MQPVFASVPALGELGVAFEMPLAIRAQARAHFIERGAVAQRGEHIVAESALREGVVHVVGHHPRDFEPRRYRDEFLHQRALFGQCVIPALHGKALREEFAELPRRSLREIVGAE